MVDYDAIFAEIKSYIEWEKFNNLIEELETELSKFDFTNLNLYDILCVTENAISVLKNIITEIVFIVERIDKDFDDIDADKKEIVVKFFDEQIDLPFYLEWIDNKLINYLIDDIVSFWNDMLDNHDWTDILKDVKKKS